MKVARYTHHQTGAQIGVAFTCPGCGSLHALTTTEPQTSNGSKWSFNGDYDKPTIRPSILVKFGPILDPEHRAMKEDQWNAEGYCICHSFVTDGKIMFLGDCTHALANHTIDLPEIES